MKQIHAQWLTVHTADIDQNTSIEILWLTAPDTLHLLVYRISHGAPGTRPHLVTEQIGPHHGLGELRQQLCLRFGELAAQRICHPTAWLPAAFQPTDPVPLRPATSITAHPPIQRSGTDPHANVGRSARQRVRLLR